MNSTPVQLTMRRDQQDVSTGRVGAEFAALLAAGFVAYAVQSLSETAGGVLAIPLYVAMCLFLWRRGRVLAKLNRQINRAIFRRKGGERSETISAWIFPTIGLLGLLFIPVGLIYVVLDRIL